MSLPAFDSIAIWYLYAVAFAPYVPLGPVSMRIEMPVGMLLALLWILRLVRGDRLRIPFAALLLGGAAIYLCLVTALSTIIDGAQPSIPSLISYVRYAGVFLFFSSLPGQKPERVVFHLLVIAVVYSVLSLAQSMNPDAVCSTITRFYTSPERASGTQGCAEEFVTRAYGVLESPTTAGLFLAVAAFLAGSGIVGGWLPIFAFVLVSLAGLATLSATFCGGYLFALAGTAFCTRQNRKHRLRIALALCALVLAGLMGVSLLDESVRGALWYQVDRIATLSVLNSRYDATEGNIASAAGFAMRDLLGHGAIIFRDRFMGDSLYVVLWNHYGLVSAAVLVGLALVFLQGGGPLGIWIAGFVFLGGIGSISAYAPRISDMLLVLGSSAIAMQSRRSTAEST